MTIKRIYIARHGFRLNWQTTIWKSPTGFPRDPPLASYGDEQAAELATHFRSMAADERPTAIFSSPYYRCLQTANPTSEALDVPIFVEHGLGEWYSPVADGTGLHPAPVPASKLHSYFNRVYVDYNPTFLVTRKGESVSDLYRRGQEVLDALIQRIEQDAFLQGHENILLVTHAATVISLAQALLGDETVGRTLRVGCCTLSVFQRQTAASSEVRLGSKAWRAVGELARADFLTNGVERDWGMNDIEVKDGVVIEDDGVPGTEGEVDIVPGVQDWRNKVVGMSRM